MKDKKKKRTVETRENKKKHRFINNKKEKKLVSHEHSNAHSRRERNDKYEEGTKKRVRKKLDKNTLILFLVIFFVAIIIFLKTMGLLMTAATTLGIIVIILCSMFLKKIRRNKVIRILTNIFTVLFLLGCIAGVCGVVYFAYIIVTEAPAWNPEELNEQQSSRLFSSDGTLLRDLSVQKREIIGYEDISEAFIDAVVAVEDSRFFQHNGFDPLRFFKASIGQLAGKKDAGGASTLSMQVIKNTFTNADFKDMNSEGIKRKFTDIYLAVFKLEKEYSKKEIFEFYANNHFLGSNSNGVEQAALTYFDKHASELTISEAATIAGLFQAPSTYNPFSHPDAATQRRSDVLRLMYEHGYITEQERNIANSIPIESLLANNDESESLQYQNYVNTVYEELERKWGLKPNTVALDIYTNIDIKKQQGLDDIFSGKTFNWENDKVQGGIAAVDVWTGKITAIAGSRDSRALSLNYATFAGNQIGSTAKPIFDYGPAIECLGWSTYTQINDEKYYYSSGQEMRNSDRQYMGWLTLREALGHSRNVPALKAFQAVQKENAQCQYDFVTGLGIKPQTENGNIYMFESHSIGAFNGASPLQMAAAYAAFANGGIYYEPYTINKLVFRDTGQTEEVQPNGHRVMSDATAYMITYSLRFAVTGGLSSGASVPGVIVAAKTGTTNFSDADAKAHNLPSYAVHDAWIVGYDPDTAVGMWYGYGKIQDGYLKSASSGFRVNVQTERNRLYKTAGKVLFSSNGKDFKVPNSVVKVAIERGTNPGKLASRNTPSSQITYEYFKKGTEPTEVSTTYNKLANVTNLKANYDILTGNVTLNWTAAAQGNDYDASYGAFGYKIYHNNTYIDFTEDTSYTLTDLTDPTGTYKVITTYENYSDTDSSGATVNLGEAETDRSTYKADLNIGNTTTYKEGDAINACLTNGRVDDKCVTLYRDNVIIPNGYTVTVKVTDSDGDKVAIEAPGTYTVEFSVKYNGVIRVTKQITITVEETEKAQ